MSHTETNNSTAGRLNVLSFSQNCFSMNVNSIICPHSLSPSLSPFLPLFLPLLGHTILHSITSRKSELSTPNQFYALNKSLCLGFFIYEAGRKLLYNRTLIIGAQLTALSWWSIFSYSESSNNPAHEIRIITLKWITNYQGRPWIK